MVLRGRKGTKSTLDSTSSTDINSPSKPIEVVIDPNGKRIISGITRYQHLSDITNPIYLEPLKHGWKRELVHRSVPSERKRFVDVYYYPPAAQRPKKSNGHTSLQKQAKNQKHRENCDEQLFGRKLRSFADVAECLESSHANSGLTIDNFVFLGTPLGINDPEKEVIRNAKRLTARLTERRIRTTAKEDVSLRESKATSRKQASFTASTTKPSHKKYLKSNSPVSKMRVREFPEAPSTSTTKLSCSRRDLKKSQQAAASSLSNRVSSTSQQASTVSKRNRKTSKKFSPPVEQPIHLRPRLRQCFSTNELVALQDEFVYPSDEPRSSPSGSPFRGFSTQATSSVSHLTLTSGTSPDSPSSAPRPSFLSISTKKELHTNYLSLPQLNPIDPFPLTPSMSPSMSSSGYSQFGSIPTDEPIIESEYQDSSIPDAFTSHLDEIYQKHRILEPEIDIVDEKKFFETDESIIGKTFQFKILVKRENAPDEARWFSLQFDNSTPIYPYLCETIRNISSNLRDKTFTLHWKDPDGDDALVESCLELREALKMMGRHRYIRFNLTVPNTDGQAARVARIFNGKYDTAHDNRYYVALLKVNPNDTTSHWCGGAIINSNYILTAAHCVYGLGKDDLIVRSGWGDIENEMLVSTTFHKISKISYPKDFFNSTCRQHQHDIALVKVRRKFDLSDDSHYKKVYLPERDNDYEDYDVKFSGFGAEKISVSVDKANNNTMNSSFKHPTVLKYFETQVVSLEECKNQLPIIVTNTNICTKAKIGAFTCTGDNGGPLVVGDIVIGIKNKHLECTPNQPELYTRVSDYLGFIEKVLSHEYSSDIVYAE